MCGIAGYIDLLTRSNKQLLENNVKLMTKAIIHRGPDDNGFWCDEEYGVGLGQARLSIIDLSPEGKQPMVSHNERYVIVFNGEIYNYLEIKEELISQKGNINFRGHSDTEVLLEYICENGLKNALKKANGMFALALWDRKEKTISFARDRLGQKPLFYGWNNNKLVFASELKALMALKNFKKEINNSSIPLYLRHCFVPAPYSIFDGIYKLPAGSFITIQMDKSGKKSHPDNFMPSCNNDEQFLSPKAYWSAKQEAVNGMNNPLDISDEEAIEKLDDLLSDSVSKCMISDVPLGAFLSGGIDSSTIVALMQKQSSKAAKTFSIGFNEAGYNEAADAKEVAKHLKTNHTELYVGQKDALDLVPSLANMYDEPFSDSSQMPTHLVSKMAREYVTVSLSGDGGDELFGGYNRYLWANKVNNFINKSCKTAPLIGKAITSIPVSSWDKIASKLPKVKEQKQFGDKLHKLAGLLDCKNEKELYLRLVSTWANPEKIANGIKEPSTVINTPSRWLETSNNLSKEDKYISDMMLLDALVYMSDDILAKVDRAAMSVSLESRVPILDHRVFEFAWRLAPHHRIRDGKGKWLLRQVLYKYVPQKLIERPKMGFGVPIDSWLRCELKDWAEDLLSKENLEKTGLLNIDEIRKTWKSHLSGRRNFQHKLWNILMLQAWYKEYM
jgi:asparagine synthase (glutamine-hydrolysing)